MTWPTEPTTATDKSAGAQAAQLANLTVGQMFRLRMRWWFSGMLWGLAKLAVVLLILTGLSALWVWHEVKTYSSPAPAHPAHHMRRSARGA